MKKYFKLVLVFSYIFLIYLFFLSNIAYAKYVVVKNLNAITVNIHIEEQQNVIQK